MTLKPGDRYRIRRGDIHTGDVVVLSEFGEKTIGASLEGQPNTTLYRTRAHWEETLEEITE
jgi:hypothetical protein